MYVPRHVPGVDPLILDPRNAWNDKNAYQQAANKLADIFSSAIGKMGNIPADVLAAAPQAQ